MFLDTVSGMEHTFGAGTVVRDSSLPLRYSRRGPVRRRLKAWIIAVAVAVAALLLLGGVAYGGASSGPEHVTVRPGDTLWAIAAAHYPGDDIQYRLAQLERVNHLLDAELSPGEILTLPAP
jgi:nucleoid-associated protein YgaU